MTLLAAAAFIIIGLILVTFFALDITNRLNPSGRELVVGLCVLVFLGMAEWYLYDYLFG